MQSPEALNQLGKRDGQTSIKSYFKAEGNRKKIDDTSDRVEAEAKAKAEEKVRLELEEQVRLKEKAELKKAKIYFKGVAYDHVFNVDIAKDVVLKLPYNIGQDPYQVAQDFIRKHELPYEYLYHIEDFIRENIMAPFEIDIDLCLKDRRPFKIANSSKSKRICVMVSCLDELRWLSKSKLDLNPEAKVSIFLEKDGTEVDDQKFFEKLSEQTRFVAKEVPFNNNDDSKMILKNLTIRNKGFKYVRIGRFSNKKKIGLKILGKGGEKHFLIDSTNYISTSFLILLSTEKVIHTEVFFQNIVTKY